MRADFSNTQASEDGGGFTEPGTIDVFNIDEVTFAENQNQKEYFEFTFSRKEDTFRNRLFISTEKLMERFNNFYEKVTGSAQVPNDENAIIAACSGKKIALKVGGQVNPDTGKGYPSLGFFNFCKKPEDVAELSFTPKEREEVMEALEAMRRTASAISNDGSAQPSQAPGSGNTADVF